MVNKSKDDPTPPKGFVAVSVPVPERSAEDTQVFRERESLAEASRILRDRVAALEDDPDTYRVRALEFAIATLDSEATGGD